MSKQLYNLKKLYNRNIQVENNSSGKTQVDFGESKKRRIILEKCFPQVFSVYLIQAHFCKRETLPNKTHTRDLIYPQRHLLKMRKNKGGNLPACAFHTSFCGQHQEWQYSQHKLFSFTLWSTYTRTDWYCTIRRDFYKINISRQRSHSDSF